MNTALQDQQRDLDGFEFINKPYRLPELIRKLNAAQQQASATAIDCRPVLGKCISA